MILLAALAANIPFLNERLFAVLPAPAFASPAKPLWLRLIEIALLYAVVLLIARLLEGRIGNVFSQGWEFFAITICLFLVLAFPGFVYRYLHKRRS